ncbi:WD40 repeat domain-containing protein [Sphaerotilus sp.]|uniref:WD40 repeat domain-containing protein n=1 Tax=Sphaerotilus sp. TaxID=2093942 RepID=UPI00286E9823|nr:WD40 repeat domain-containing protein [Sphaerotilus sp.]
MTTRTAALVTQIQSIVCSADGKRLKVTRIARGKHAAVVELDAQTLAAVATAPTDWLPVASIETGLKTRTNAWSVGKFGAGLFVHSLSGSAIKAPPPFNDASLTVTAFAISKDECYALVGNSSGFVSVFDTHSGDECFGQRLHRGHVTAACFTPDSKQAFTGSAGGELCAIDLPQ